MSKFHRSIRILILMLLINSVPITTGCARNGEFSKEGTYEILRGINKSQHTSIYNETNDDMSYQEYERNRESILVEERK